MSAYWDSSDLQKGTAAKKRKRRKKNFCDFCAFSWLFNPKLENVNRLISRRDAPESQRLIK
jgi:hypothetical protein